MPRRGNLTFFDAERPIEGFTTKFGGQPNWLGEIQWPISRSLGQPMRFICQIAIPPELFPGAGQKMAYVFMTDGDEYAEATWEPLSGENAVIIQPADEADEPVVSVRALGSGPTLRRFRKSLFSRRLKPTNVEIGVTVQWSDDPVFISEPDRMNVSTEDDDNYWEAIQGNKLGGSPAFIQADEFPDEGAQLAAPPATRFDLCAVRRQLRRRRYRVRFRR
jgi:hypothetical protein